MRSNDFIYGASGVNIFNYTFMQEYFASILGLKVGYYIHIANNMHYYDLHRSLVSSLASLSDVEDEGTPYHTQPCILLPYTSFHSTRHPKSLEQSPLPFAQVSLLPYTS